MLKRKKTSLAGRPMPGRGREINYVEMSCEGADLRVSRDELMRVARVTRSGTSARRRRHPRGCEGRDFFVILGKEKGACGRGGRDPQARRLFGELALFDPAPRNATVTAIGKLRSRLTQPEFHDVPVEETIRDSILTGMARRLHELDSQV
jgi:hypothetical protein